MRNQHYETRQVLILTTQAIADPGTKTGPTWLLAARLNKSDGRVVVNRFRVYRFDDRDVVDNFCRVGKQFTQPGTGLPMLLEVEDRLRNRKSTLAGRHSGDALAVPHRTGEFSAMGLVQAGLVVEQIELGRATGLVQINDPFGFGCKVG